MIINIRGTGGSGKSTVVRDVMARYETVTARHVTGRRRPAGYLCARPDGPSLYVPGHYETPCGGCDTITSPNEVFDAIEAQAAQGHDVLYEGIIVQDAFDRTLYLHKQHGLVVLGLRVPIEVCLESIRTRRSERGDQRELNPKNTIGRQRSVERSMTRLREAGVDARWVTRDEALATCVELLGLGERVAEATVVGRSFQLF